jgi:hypothetical protein
VRVGRWYHRHAGLLTPLQSFSSDCRILCAQVHIALQWVAAVGTRVRKGSEQHVGSFGVSMLQCVLDTAPRYSCVLHPCTGQEHPDCCWWQALRAAHPWF